MKEKLIPLAVLSADGEPAMYNGVAGTLKVEGDNVYIELPARSVRHNAADMAKHEGVWMHWVEIPCPWDDPRSASCS